MSNNNNETIDQSTINQDNNQDNTTHNDTHNQTKSPDQQKIDQLMHALAHYQNQFKQQQKEHENQQKYIQINTIRKFLPLVSNLDIALQHPIDKQALQMLYDQCIKTITTFNITLIVPKTGDTINPHEHQIISTHEDTTLPNNTVYKVIQKGYKNQDTILQAATIIVVKNT